MCSVFISISHRNSSQQTAKSKSKIRHREDDMGTMTELLREEN